MKPTENGEDTQESIAALTFGKAHIVASAEGQTKSTPAKPPKRNWRNVELLVDSGAVDDVGDPKSFPEYKMRDGEGHAAGCITWQQITGRSRAGVATPVMQKPRGHPVQAPDAEHRSADPNLERHPPR